MYVFYFLPAHFIILPNVTRTTTRSESCKSGVVLSRQQLDEQFLNSLQPTIIIASIYILIYIISTLEYSYYHVKKNTLRIGMAMGRVG
jgi:predicted secreted protein